MEKKELKKINHISDFADLFMAIYTLKNVNEDNVVEIPAAFKNALDETIDEYFGSFVEKTSFVNEDGDFDKNLFYEYVKCSKSKKYYADDFKYNLKNNTINYEANKEYASNLLKTYNSESIIFVNNFTSKYLEKMENESEMFDIDLKRKYIKLNIKVS